MANRNRTNPVQFYLSDDEQYILNTKFKASGMKSMSAFLRKLILYGYVYDVDYSYLRNYNTELGRISSSLNQIAKQVYEYYGAAEPLVRCGESHLSGLTEPLRSLV